MRLIKIKADEWFISALIDKNAVVDFSDWLGQCRLWVSGQCITVDSSIEDAKRFYEFVTKILEDIILCANNNQYPTQHVHIFEINPNKMDTVDDDE